MLLTPLDARAVKRETDIVAIVGQFTRLRRAGRQVVGLCPLHKERNPSFFVHPKKQCFKCFGCGAGGDVFEFVMRATGCNFPRALEIVAEFLKGVASGSGPRSGPRSAASVGAKPLSPAKRGSLYSQDSRARILAALDATNRRLRVIEATNRKARAATATACEPWGEGEALLLENKG